MLSGLVLATIMLLIALGGGYRQLVARRRIREQPYMPEEDRRYLRRQTSRRLLMSGLLLVESMLIYTYYLSGMDARMDAIPERAKGADQPAPDDPRGQSDRQFALLAASFWIGVILLLGLWVLMAIFDVLASRTYWMARYKELKADHETKLQRDLAVYRQQKLNQRVKGLKKPNDDEAADA